MMNNLMIAAYIILVVFVAGYVGYIIRSKDKQIDKLNKSVDDLREKLTKASGLPMKTNLQTDIEFLNFMILRKVEDVEIYKIRPCKIAQVAIINDKDYQRWKDEAIMQVYSELSPAYQRLLMGYFTKEALMTYITEQISGKITSKILESNLRIEK